MGIESALLHGSLCFDCDCFKFELLLLLNNLSAGKCVASFQYTYKVFFVRWESLYSG